MMTNKCSDRSTEPTTELMMMEGAVQQQEQTPPRHQQGSHDTNNSNDPTASTKKPQQQQPTAYASSSSSSKWIFVAVILLLGAAASAAFLTLGIVSQQQEHAEHFAHEAQELVYAVQLAWREYELFGLWIHESCVESLERRRTEIDIKQDVEGYLGLCSRRDFRNLYEHVASYKSYTSNADDRLQFQAVQMLPKVYHSEREELERQSKLYYEQNNYTSVNYQGITQAEMMPSSGTNGTTTAAKEQWTFVPRSEQAFYWPVHYVEPVATNEAAIELDSYSLTQKERIEKAVKTYKPVLSERRTLVQETDPHAFGIILQHPGVATSVRNGTEPTALSQIVIRVPDLLQRATSGVVVNKLVYLHDSTTDDSHQQQQQTEPVFLGAVSVQCGRADKPAMRVNLPETSLANVPGPKSGFSLASDISIADRVWTVTVVSAEEQDHSDLVYIILGGAIIFAACILLAIWFQTSTARVAKLNKMRSQAETEKANHARLQVARERHMNEFLSHEVRNPLSSAISALSFVTATVRDPNQCQVTNETVRSTLTYDLRVMDASLQFINELLRNMLDIHRSASQQMKLDLSPTDILHDIMDPVASILFMRGASVDVRVECPRELVASTDRMRLKQIILNLAANATKFVERGYICLRAQVVDGSVELSVEDSGPGIPEDKRDRLFLKFQESLDALNQGTGIGLAVCKNLSDLMGADLSLDESFQSGVDGCLGTRFVLRLNQPALEVERDDDAPDEEKSSLLSDSNNSASEPPHVGGSKLPENLLVMFVDDDTILRRMFSRSLKRVAPNWEVQEASNGETALRMTETNKFDLIFVDQYVR